jgi:predicted GIY-YIG superfamily endonuclease
LRSERSERLETATAGLSTALGRPVATASVDIDSRSMAFTYILRCSDGSYYVGSSRNLEHRLWQHDNGVEGAEYTRRRRPVTLVWAAEFEHIGEAFAFEKRIQGWSRAKREALIRGEYDSLPWLARRRT